MKTPIVGGYNDSLSNISVEYNSITGGYLWDTDRTRMDIPFPTDGILHTLHVKLTTAPTDNPYIFTVMKDGVATTLTVTIPVGSTEATSSGLSVDITPGCKICLRSSYSGAPTNTPVARWSTIFEGDDATESIILGTGWRSSLGVTYYYGLMHGGRNSVASSDMFGARSRFPTGGTLKKMYAYSTISGTNTLTFAVYKGGVASGLAATFANNVLTPDLVHTVAVVDDDYAQLRVTRSGSISSGYITWSMVFVPTTVDEFIFLFCSTDPPGYFTTEYNGVFSGDPSIAWSTTLMTWAMMFPAVLMTRIRAVIETAGGMGTSQVIGLRKTTGVTLLSVELSDLEVNEALNYDVAIAKGTYMVVQHRGYGGGAQTQIGLVGKFIPLPTVTSALPNSANRAGTQKTIVLGGTSFTTTTSIDFGADITVDDFDIDSDLQITAYITIAPTAALGARDVSVTNGAGTGTLSGGFTVLAALAPVVISVNPVSGKIGESLPVEVFGSGFIGTVSVDFGDDVNVDSFFVIDDLNVSCNLTIASGATLGLRSITVTNVDASDVGIDLFTVTDLSIPVPSLTDPEYGTAGESGYWVMVYGDDLTGYTSIDFGAGITVTNSFYIDDSTLAAELTIEPTATFGYRDVTVTNPKGAGIAIDTFEIIPPTAIIDHLTVGYGEEGHSITGVILYGSNFTYATDVQFSGVDITVDAFTIISDTEISVNITIALGATVGYVDVYVNNSYNIGTLVNGFEIWPFANVVDSWSSCTVVATSFDPSGSSGGFIGITWNGIMLE